MEDIKKVEPLRFEYDGKEYTLEFSRKTVADAERGGFTIDDITEHMMVRVPELFYYAFKMHHPFIKKTDTDKILFEGFGGLTNEELKRLGDLYAEPYNSLINKEEDGESKNSRRVTIL